MWDITKIQLWQNTNVGIHIHINVSTLFWKKAKVYFMCIKLLWWLITVQCTYHGQNPLNHLRYITTKIHLQNNGHKCYILAQSQCICYIYIIPIVMDYSTKYEQNQSFYYFEILQRTLNLRQKYSCNIVQHKVLLWHLVLVIFGENQSDMVRFGVIQWDMVRFCKMQ